MMFDDAVVAWVLLSGNGKVFITLVHIWRETGLCFCFHPAYEFWSANNGYG